VQGRKIDKYEIERKKERETLSGGNLLMKKQMVLYKKGCFMKGVELE